MSQEDTHDESTDASPELLEKISENLTKLYPDEDEPTLESDSIEPAESDDSTPEPEGGDTETEPADDDDSTPEPESEPADESESETESEPEKPAIPDNYYRAAIHRGWTPERISKLYEADPEGTVDFLKKTYEDVNSMSKQFADFGRKAKEMQQAPAAKQEPEQKPDVFDPEAFKKVYDEDPAAAMVLMFEAMQKQSQQQPQAPVQQPQQTSQDEMRERLSNLEQLNGFFNDDDLKAFGDYYGQSKKLDWGDITPDQYANRKALVDRADEILVGAELLQTGMSIREAVEKAHLEITAPMLKEIVRQDIIKQVKKKAKGATLRPTKRKEKAPKPGGKLSNDEVIDKIDARLATLREKGL